MERDSRVVQVWQELLWVSNWVSYQEQFHRELASNSVMLISFEERVVI